MWRFSPAPPSSRPGWPRAARAAAGPGRSRSTTTSIRTPRARPTQAVAACTKQSHGKYTISYQQLPTASDGQRLQLVRRLAAHDNTIDIMGLDVTWEAEFAQAGWLRPWTGSNKQQAEHDTLKPMLQTATWKGKLYAVPDNTNTQLLWYRSDLVKTPPKTWTEMINDSIKLAKAGQAAPDRDPGRTVRGRDGLVQHDAGQRGRKRADPGRRARLAGQACDQGTDDHEAPGHVGRGRPVAGCPAGERQPAGDGGRGQRPSS